MQSFIDCDPTGQGSMKAVHSTLKKVKKWRKKFSVLHKRNEIVMQNILA